MIGIGSATGQFVYQWVVGAWQGFHETLGVSVLASIIYLCMARSAGLYRFPALIDPLTHMRRIAAVCILVLLSVTAVLFLLKQGSAFSRGTVLGFGVLMLVLCCLTRIGAASLIELLLDRRAITARPVFLIGEPDELASLSPAYLLRHFGFQEVGRVELEHPATFKAQIDDAIAEARRSEAKELVVAVSFDHLEELTEVEAALRFTPLPVRLLPNHVFRAVVGRHTSSPDAGVQLIDLKQAPMSVPEQFAKRLLDLFLAAGAIVALSPLLLLVACAIKLDSPGPIIFRQRRSGFDQRHFVIFKFRTMTVLEDGGEVMQARRHDRRITRVGSILRRTSLDELPQLFNVLRGDMSLVGPRPHALAHDDAYKIAVRDYLVRHHVKPGMTGWAQVNGSRGETAKTEDMRKRVDLDTWYVANWSLLLDVQILVRTCFEVMRHDAY